MELDVQAQGRQGQRALLRYTTLTDLNKPINAAAYARAARNAADEHARGIDRQGFEDLATKDKIEAVEVLSDVVADVLHHMSGRACPKALLRAADWQFKVDCGEEERSLIIFARAEESEIRETVRFLASLAHAAVSLDDDETDLFVRALTDYQHELKDSGTKPSCPCGELPQV